MLGNRLRPLAAAAALAASVTLAACDISRSGPAEVMVLAYDATAKQYLPRKVRLETPTDLTTMTGSAAHLVAQASFEVANGLLTVRNRGSAVHVDFLEQDDGTLVPADFDSLNIATTYYNFERSAGFFGRLDPGASGIASPKVYYFADLVVDGTAVKDNAAFETALRGFLVLPFDRLQKLPLSINAGVIGHEYSHAIFNQRVCGDAQECRGSTNWAASHSSPTPGFNLFASLNEGIADVFGTAITCADDLSACDLEFIAASLGARTGGERRVDVPQCLLPSLRDCLLTSNFDVFSGGSPSRATPCGEGGNEYGVGSVFASALWAAATYPAVTQVYGREDSLRRMLKVLYDTESGANSLAALIDAAGADQSRFRLESADGVQGVLDSVVAKAAGDLVLQEALCNAFIDRFQLDPDSMHSDMPSCPEITHHLPPGCPH